jgi:hypothetical protein
MFLAASSRSSPLGGHLSSPSTNGLLPMPNLPTHPQPQDPFAALEMTRLALLRMYNHVGGGGAGGEALDLVRPPNAPHLPALPGLPPDFFLGGHDKGIHLRDFADARMRASEAAVEAAKRAAMAEDDKSENGDDEDEEVDAGKDTDSDKASVSSSQEKERRAEHEEAEERLRDRVRAREDDADDDLDEPQAKRMHRENNGEATEDRPAFHMTGGAVAGLPGANIRITSRGMPSCEPILSRTLSHFIMLQLPFAVQ